MIRKKRLQEGWQEDYLSLVDTVAEEVYDEVRDLPSHLMYSNEWRHTLLSVVEDYLQDRKNAWVVYKKYIEIEERYHNPDEIVGWNEAVDNFAEDVRQKIYDFHVAEWN